MREQLASQRVAYMLGAGSSYLDGGGYPLASGLWPEVKVRISDSTCRDEIQAKLDVGASGLEQALDLLDQGLPDEGKHRRLVIDAVADYFLPLSPSVDLHAEFLVRLARRSQPFVRVFSLNYDPLIERGAEHARVRLYDGFIGHEHAFFEPAGFEERIGRIRGTHRGRELDETAKPIHLLKLHGSLGWYECPTRGTRRTAFDRPPPASTKRLMVPPQRRKAADTMSHPYAALWSIFRGTLGQDAVPINRLVCLGYGFADSHVNAVIEVALGRPDFTLLAFTKHVTDEIWNRWSPKANVVLVTETRSAMKSECGDGHPTLWKFENVAKEI